MLAFDHRQHQDLVPGGIESDLVDAIAEAIVRSQLGPETIGARRQRRQLGAAERRAPLLEPVVRPRGAASLDGGAQRAIG
jgi:hypothetical protein